MVGDPSGKSEERNLLSTEVLNYNVISVKKQLEKFLDFSAEKDNAAEMVNNYDWFKEIFFLDFIRDTGKHITINYMLAKDSVRKRLETENGMSFTEFTYQLVQGYDFYWLYKNKNCKLQFGGSDQWGNIVTGTELIRRKNGGEAFAFTCPLLTKSDGSKFGKSEKGMYGSVLIKLLLTVFTSSGLILQMRMQKDFLKFLHFCRNMKLMTWHNNIMEMNTFVSFRRNWLKN